MLTFTSITVFYGTNIGPQNILYIHIEFGEYFVEYFQSHITLLWADIKHPRTNFQGQPSRENFEPK